MDEERQEKKLFLRENTYGGTEILMQIPSAPRRKFANPLNTELLCWINWTLKVFTDIGPYGQARHDISDLHVDSETN